MPKSDRMLEIPASVIEDVTKALNQAIALATRFEPTLQPGILSAACALDDAVNDAIATEA